VGEGAGSRPFVSSTTIAKGVKMPKLFLDEQTCSNSFFLLTSYHARYVTVITTVFLENVNAGAGGDTDTTRRLSAREFLQLNVSSSKKMSSAIGSRFTALPQLGPSFSVFPFGFGS